MIHPSYFELMDVVNQDVPEGGDPIVTSRYSIVLGTAKRARQIIAANANEVDGEVKNPLSMAVDELMNGEVHILPAASESSGDSAEDADGEDEDAEEDAEDVEEDDDEG